MAKSIDDLSRMFLFRNTNPLHRDDLPEHHYWSHNFKPGGRYALPVDMHYFEPLLFVAWSTGHVVYPANDLVRTLPLCSLRDIPFPLVGLFNQTSASSS